MYKITIVLLVGVIVGLLAGNFFPFNPLQPAVTDMSSTNAVDNTEWQARLQSLETLLAEEVARGDDVEAMLFELSSGNSEAEIAGNVAAGRQRLLPVNTEGEVIEDPEQLRSNFREMRNNMRGRFEQFNSATARRSRFEEAGFSNEQATWLIEREEEQRLDALYEGWEERRQRVLQNNSDRISVADKIKSELGDDGYESYLQASGMPTSVRVDNIMDRSPAQSAGLQAGDEIVSYNGDRIFNIQELNNATVQGSLGEPVVLNVNRDGVELQIVMERGPLGIVTRSSRGRGRAFQADFSR